MTSLEPSEFIELILRGATSGICLMAAIRLVKPKLEFGTSNLGALFAIGCCAYAIIGASGASVLGNLTLLLFVFLATLNSVFFWWFATSLFDDDFRWKPSRFGPAVLMVCLFTQRKYAPSTTLAGEGGDILQQAVNILMMGHVIWLAVSNRGDDLLEMRRKFRPFFALVVGVTGLVIAVVELGIGRSEPPGWLTLFHAGALTTLALFFGTWVIQANDLFKAKLSPEHLSSSGSVDGAALARLRAALDDRIYLEEGLNLAKLSQEIAYPEYKLRKLINHSLGFRNFQAFLSSYRIEDAKRRLADPGEALTPVTQIAFDLGFGSIATFNRSFKSVVGATPSEFRKRSLENAALK